MLIAGFLALGGIIAMNFTEAWYTFHTLFFSNELWQMDPATDLMIQMLPEPFSSVWSNKSALLWR